MARKLLPIGIQTLRKVRERNCYYVDKTGFAVRLAEEGTHYFLSRPRRFGKSLFLDTLKELFAGSRELFAGLQAHDRWDWSARHPVVRLDFSGRDYKIPGTLGEEAGEQLSAIERDWSLKRRSGSEPGRLRDLIRTLHRRSGQRVAVLVDEYDKPILDALEEPEVARANRDYLRGLYSMIKFCDAHVRFCFLTGVSKFSKVSLFSGLNNLIDITLDPSYSSICGYTEEDLGTVFGPELEGLDRNRVRDWYNGYSWGGAERVYNPFDVLLLFRNAQVQGVVVRDRHADVPRSRTLARTPECLPLQRWTACWPAEKLLGTFDVDRIATEALLFQTGYLTLVRRRKVQGGSRVLPAGLSESGGCARASIESLAGRPDGRRVPAGRATWASACGGSCCKRPTLRGWSDCFTGPVRRRSRTSGTVAMTID